MLDLNYIVSSNPLFFVFLFPALMDCITTLLGQDKDYWNKKNRVVNEASPAFYFLKFSPWLFLSGSIVWFFIWYWIIQYLREPYNIFIVIVFIAGHSWGSSSWIMNMMKKRGLYKIGDQLSIMKAWTLIILYFCLIAFFASHSLILYFNN